MLGNIMPINKPWKTLNLQQQSNILVVQLDSGKKANTFSFEMMQELLQLANDLHSDTELAAIVLHGSNNIFTGGMDLSDASPDMIERVGLASWRQKMQLGPRLCEAWERLEPLTIVAIEGWCVGAGVALASACDLRLAGESATIYVPEIQHGMNMSWGSVPRLVNLIGPSRCKRLLLLAEKLDAKRAADWGWLDEVVVDGSSLNEAMLIAQRAADMPLLSLRMSKQSINAAAQALSYSSSFMDTDQLILSQSSDDFANAMQHFNEKKK
jgi:enoyl-CoA hydratase/carnithine racemase